MWNSDIRYVKTMMVFLAIVSCLVIAATLSYLLVWVLFIVASLMLNHIRQEMVYIAIRKGTCPPLEDCRLQDDVHLGESE